MAEFLPVHADAREAATAVARLMFKAFADEWRFEKRRRKLDKLEVAMERRIHDAARYSNVYPIRGGHRPEAVDDARRAAMEAAEILLAVVRAESAALRESSPYVHGRP